MIKFPFIVYRQVDMHWQCTVSEPFCATFGNEDLEVTICHMFIKSYLYYNPESSCYHLSKTADVDTVHEKNIFYHSKIDLSKEIKQELEHEYKRYTPMFGTLSQFEELPRYWQTEGEVKIQDFGFIQTSGNHKFLKRTYKAFSYDEYFELEFSSRSHKVDTKFLQAEMQFIIDNMEGKPNPEEK